MTLAAGDRVGAHEILSSLGSGGMGEVYRARDTRLNRDVALKILPADFQRDPERLARFKREAQVLAALNHPNIAAIYGLEGQEGRDGQDSFPLALVLELVEGPTLADRIAQGALPLDETLPIAKQIAEALEAAHEQGIIHRDLKPANIKIRSDGAVKVLDFGLAKAFEPAPTGGPEMTNSPTLSMQATFAGVILGTAAYMSPEQASGKPVDKRADIWSFGVVLWEMLTGASLFAAETISHTLADVLRAPIDVSQLPPHTPPAVRDLLRRCLDRDVRRRLRDIGEARVTIEQALADPAGSANTAARPSTVIAVPWWRRAAPLLTSAVLAAAVSALVVLRIGSPAPAPTVVRFTYVLPEGQQFAPADRHLVDVSPDGTQIVYVANQRLYRKTMWELEATPVTGSDSPLGLVNPVFSEDGRSIAFFGGIPGGGAIKKIPSSGGTPVTLTTTFANPFGITWDGDRILFGQGGLGIMRVSAGGGAAERLVSVKAGEATTYPQMLPGGDALLYTRGSTDFTNDTDAEVVVRSLKSGAEKTVIRNGNNARFVPTGHLLYAMGGVVFAVPFDLQKLETTGEPVPVMEGIRRGAVGVGGSAHFSVSSTGTLAYVPGPASLSLAQRDVAMIDRTGKVEPLKLPSAQYESPRVSPDGKRIAVVSLEGKEAVIWIYDLSGATSIRRLTFGSRNRFPIWSNDSERVAFQSDREGDLAIFAQRADGTGKAERLTRPERGASHVPDSWSPGGDRILFSETKGDDVSAWTLSVQDRKATPFGDIRSLLPIDAAFSPDGKWVTYQAGRTGDNAIYVKPFPATDAKYQVSKGNAHHPVWSRDGKEIIYLPAQSLPLVASISTEPSFAVGNNPVQLPVKGNENGPATVRNYDVMPDGRLVGVVNTGQPPSGVPVAQQIRVVLNWFEELKQRVAVK
jgi:serine/threonine-protein kinase